MGELIGCLTTLGEKMTHEDATRVTSDIVIGASGGIALADIVRTMTEPIMCVSPNIEDLMRTLPGV